MESKKKGLAVTAIVALTAMKPASRTELVVVGGVVLIALVGILVQAYLDRGKKNETETTTNNVPIGD